MKRALALVLLLLALAGCGKPGKLLHCDGCGREVTVAADSNMDEDWIILCEDCRKQLEP